MTPPDVASNLAAVQRSLADVVDEAVALRKDAKSAEKVRRVKEWLLIAVIVGMLIVLWQNNQTSRDAARAAQTSKRTSEQVADCITPTGRCYQDSSKRQGGAVKVLTRVQILVAVCSKTATDEAAISACVAQRLATAAK